METATNRNRVERGKGGIHASEERKAMASVPFPMSSASEGAPLTPEPARAPEEERTAAGVFEGLLLRRRRDLTVA